MKVGDRVWYTWANPLAIVPAWPAVVTYVGFTAIDIELDHSYLCYYLYEGTVIKDVPMAQLVRNKA